MSTSPTATLSAPTQAAQIAMRRAFTWRDHVVVVLRHHPLAAHNVVATFASLTVASSCVRQLAAAGTAVSAVVIVDDRSDASICALVGAHSADLRSAAAAADMMGELTASICWL